MNEGEAIGLLVGLATPPKPERPLLLQHWDPRPAGGAMVIEAVAVLLDLPVSDPQEAWHEAIRRRNFNTIRGRSGDERFSREPEVGPKE